MDGRPSDKAVSAALIAAGLAFAVTSSITLALPDIGRELRASQSEVQFIQDGYMVVLGALVLPAGALLDRYGRRRGMLVGLAILTVGLLWSAVSGSPAELILSRCLSGLGAALVLPGTLATITAVLPDDQRARGVALWAGCTMLGAGLGIVASGAMLEAVSWQASCALTAAMAVVTLLVVARSVPETGDPEHANLDPVGALLCCVALGALIVGVIELPVRGLDDSLVLGSFALGAAVGWLFVAWELRTEQPMLELRLFRNPSFAVGAVSIFLLFAAGYGWFFLCFLYMVFVLDLGPLLSGVALVPFLVTLIPSALAGPRLADRHGRRRVMAGSLVAVAVSMAVMALAGGMESYPPMIVGFMILGVGVGLGQAPPTQAILEALPARQQGVASAVNDATREIGGAVGVAVMGALFNFGYRGDVDAALEPTSGALSDAVQVGPAVGDEIASGGGLLDGLVDATVDRATIVGWETAFAAGVAIFLLSALVVHLWPGRTEALDATTPEPEPPRDPDTVTVRPAPSRRPARVMPSPALTAAPQVVAPIAAVVAAAPVMSPPAPLDQARRFAEQTNGRVALVQFADGPERWTVFLGHEPVAAFPVYGGDLVAALRYHDRERLRMHAPSELAPA